MRPTTNDEASTPTNHRSPRNDARTWATVLGLYALLGGLLSFAGWAADIQRLTDWYNNGISIQPNATVAVMCSGAALLLLGWGYRRTAAAIGVVIAMIGASALVQYAVDVDFARLNTLLMFGREWGRVGVVDPGRMGPPGALCWTLIGVALVLTSFPMPRVRRIVPRLALLTFAIATLSVAGYFYGVSRLYSLPYLTVIAFQTATFIAAVSAGIIAMVPEHAPARWLLDPGATGVVARRAIPLIIVVPFVVGWLRLQGEHLGLYDTRFGVTMLVVVLIILLLAILSWTLRTIAQHESALQQSERRVTAALESITDGFVTLDRDWRFRFVNAEAAAMLRKPVAELLGSSAWDTFPEAVGGSGYRELHRAAAERTTVEFDDFNPVLQRWFAARAYPTSDGAIAIYFKDITARKQAEEERAADLAGMSRLQHLSTRLVQRGDLSSLLGEILTAAVDLTGATKGNIQFYDRETGQLRIFAHQGFGPEFVEYFAARGSPYGCELAAQRIERVVCEDVASAPDWQGTEDLRVLLDDGIRAFQSTPLVSREGRLLGVLNTHFGNPHRLADRELRHLDLLSRMAADFIERSQAEEALRKADRMKDEFLAMLAHELRNPLAPIQNAVQVLRLSRPDDERIRSTTDMLTRQVGQLVRLVDDLVDVSRITRGKIELIRERVELSAVVHQAVEAVQPLVEAKDQDLDVVVPASPIWLNADFTRLTQVLGNVLGNATKFTARGGKISLVAECEPDGGVAIRVRDAGIGIPADQLPRIFDLFMQGDTSLERSVSGLGIGLTLVKTLVEMHGGRIEAHSEGPGKGSEFILRLPTIPGPQELADASAGNGERAAKPRRVLIVDDNADGAESLARVLALSGHATHTAHDGLEAVTMAERFRPDVVLLDIGLPKLNGYEACRRIREQPWGKQMKLVAVTGWGQEAYRERSSNAGFDTHVVKPVDSETLIRLLQRE